MKKQKKKKAFHEYPHFRKVYYVCELCLWIVNAMREQNKYEYYGATHVSIFSKDQSTPTFVERNRTKIEKEKILSWTKYENKDGCYFCCCFVWYAVGYRLSTFDKYTQNMPFSYHICSYTGRKQCTDIMCARQPVQSKYTKKIPFPRRVYDCRV